ncbi:MAG: C25 family cysteine peptidase [Chitinophagaceae bacterium]
MKRVLFLLVFFSGFVAKAQLYNNEWIDYNKTYYKFKVGKTGLYRIPHSTLSSAGLGTASAQHFQLWRNGVQVPVYTSIVSGTFSAGDYIEFWGEMNDGKPDNQLYRNPVDHLNPKWSLETDTASYFLTVNTAGNNLRLTNTTNNAAGNTLPAEPYFMYTAGKYFRDKIHNGLAANAGEYVYSSAYDKGEGWTSNDVGANTTNSFTFNDLFVFSGGPNAKFKIAVSGNSFTSHNYRAKINSDSVTGGAIDLFNYRIDSAIFSTSVLSSGSANVQVTNQSPITNDRIVIHQYELTYPRQFNFGGATNFEFTLPANTSGNYLEVRGFTYGNVAPVLYDLTNGKRYVGNISAAPVIKFTLEPSATERKLVLVSEEAGNINAVSSLQIRNFVNYNVTTNQGNYLIISHPLLYNTTGGNPVEEYRLYRSSGIGGGFNAKVYLVEELVDQFGFGIKKNPLGIRNFIRFARNKFAPTPTHVFIIGKGVNYVHQRLYENDVNADKLNLVPTFGWPASDILLAAEPGSAVPQIPIGRLSVINSGEVSVYLQKVKEFELAQRTGSPLIVDKAWMKNVVHVVGASEPALQTLLDQYMAKYKAIVSDTFFGAKVTTFSKTNPDAVQQINSSVLENLFAEGITLLTYFGHSSTSQLEYNLNDPAAYNNKGKYPMFVALGCLAGDFYNLNPARFTIPETISEKFVLAPERGSIGFIASTHFGVVNQLDIWTTKFYNSASVVDYGKTIGEIMQSTIRQVFTITGEENFFARSNAEQTALNGDPAARLNPHAKPDYVVEDALIKVSPSFISIAETSFKVDAKFLNIGKAINKNIIVQVKRESPGQGSVVIFRDTIPGIRFIDSVSFSVPIDPNRDKGLNKITVTIDADNNVDELYETNNSVTKEVFVYEDEIRPVYPYNFSIVNKQNIKLAASTANPLSEVKQYRMELDTTALFNSPLKITKTVTSLGGLIEFEPGITFTNNTVYYWRVAPVPSTGTINWNAASFVYLPNHDFGYNQSHIYQHLQSSAERISYNTTSGRWQYDSVTNNVFVQTGVFPTAGRNEGDFIVGVNGDPFIRSACIGSSLIFNVFDPVSFRPIVNLTGAYGSALPCQPSRNWNFEFSYLTSESRKKAMDFMDAIPVGSYVVVRNILNDVEKGLVAEWQKDTSLFGSQNSIYHKLKQAGFSELDSLNRARAFAFIYRKGNSGFVPVYKLSEGIYDMISLSSNIRGLSGSGTITSPVFGPAKSWKELRWSGSSLENAGDQAILSVIGIQQNGSKDTLLRNITSAQTVVDISSISAVQYSYLQLHLRNTDTTNYTPYQLNYWRITYVPVPEGAVAPNLYFNLKDSLGVGEQIDFKMAFKNVSDANFDSLRVRIVLTDKNNVTHTLPVQKHRPLAAGDTVHIRHRIDTRLYQGANALFVEVNPDNDQPEQHHFNNFIFNNFNVDADNLSPLLDVTFDNVHILNRDIVSAKPDIVIQLKDEAKFSLLDDTSLVTVKVRYPDGSIRPFYFNNDSLKFTPAQQGSNNTATVNFKPFFEQDGEYELIITGKDKSNNLAGNMEYRVAFQIINKPMISNMLNYPNPFTTSTAFVFTITGVEVPQNLKIQILTVTGKIVREITKQELGPLRVGRNITEFKWDGTDQYGQKLGNGVYLYRVVTNLNGRSLDKYKSESDNTEKYFNKGYGKMVLIR